MSRESDSSNVIADGNVTLSWRWKGVNALSVLVHSKLTVVTREMVKLTGANGIRSSEKCSAVFQKYTPRVNRLETAINVNCIRSRASRPSLPKIVAVQLYCNSVVNRSTTSLYGVYIYSNVIRFVLLRVHTLATRSLFIGIKYGTRSLTLAIQCQDSCHYHHGSSRITHIPNYRVEIQGRYTASMVNSEDHRPFINNAS